MDTDRNADDVRCHVCGEVDCRRWWHVDTRSATHGCTSLRFYGRSGWRCPECFERYEVNAARIDGHECSGDQCCEAAAEAADAARNDGPGGEL